MLLAAAICCILRRCRSFSAATTAAAASLILTTRLEVALCNVQMVMSSHLASLSSYLTYLLA